MKTHRTAGFINLSPRVIPIAIPPLYARKYILYFIAYTPPGGNSGVRKR